MNGKTERSLLVKQSNTTCSSQRMTAISTKTVLWLPLLTFFLILSPPAQAAEGSENGELLVQVLYHGIIPPPQSFKVTRNPELCGLTKWIQPIIVEKSTGGVKNAVISIDDAPPANPETPPAPPLILTNRDCRFFPLATSIRVGTAVEIRNEDPVMHNTHITHDRKTLLNITLLPTTPPISKIVKKSGIYRVKCDAHTFMNAYMIATDHPYIGISDEIGNARVSNIPAGKYTFTVWHEHLGMIQQQVEITALKRTHVTVVFPDRAEPPSESAHP